MRIKYLFVSLVLLYFVSACTKIRETDIGTGLIPSIDGVITKDTNITINARNWTNEDTARPSIYEDHALGYINDPLFGTTSAAINVQMQPLSFPFSFGGSGGLTLDSVVLALDVRNSWGDTTLPLSLHVKELDNDQTFINDTSYIIYNSYTKFTASNDLTYNGSAQVDVRTLNDSFHVYQDSGKNMLRVRLTDAFGDRLLHSYDSTKEYLSDSAFRVAFKGFQISADAVGNSLLQIGLANSSAADAEANTKLAIYYKTKTTAGTDTSMVRYFTIHTSTSAHSNYIERNLNAGQAGAYFTDTMGRTNDDYLFMQSSPGTKAIVTIDSAALRSLPNWIIHRAEIVMEQAPDPASPVLDALTAPYLFLLAKESNNDSILFKIPGFNESSLVSSDANFTSGVLANYNSFGGYPLRKYNNDHQSINYYSFNISRYIQGIVTNHNPAYSFVLYAPYKEYFRLLKDQVTYAHVSAAPLNQAGIGRVRLFGGGTNPANPQRMKLHIVYSIPH